MSKMDDLWAAYHKGHAATQRNPASFVLCGSGPCDDTDLRIGVFHRLTLTKRLGSRRDSVVLK